MSDQKKINNSVIRLAKDDITALDIECFVYYADSDLKLGSGFGGAISLRGGIAIQRELDTMAPIDIGQAVITGAGDLKAKYIIHANGPKFQEEELEDKLRTTVINVLKLADERGIKAIAFPPIGAGFYCVPPDLSARLTMETVSDYLKGETGINEVVFCLLDIREYKPFLAQLQKLG